MMTCLLRKINLFLDPPKKGDIYYGDPVWFIISRPTEFILHGLKDKYGNIMYDPVPSKGGVRFIIEHCGNLNFILGSEVLCHLLNRNKPVMDINDFVWKKRTQPRRMAREMFREFVLTGMLWKE
jgi:hypothetical protein